MCESFYRPQPHSLAYLPLLLLLCTIFAPYDDFFAFMHIGTYFWRKWQKKKYACRWWAAARTRTEHKKLSTCFGIPTWLFDYRVWIYGTSTSLCVYIYACKCLLNWNSFQLREINREKVVERLKYFWDNFCVIYLWESSANAFRYMRIRT